jgi:hypothetical protein
VAPERGFACRHDGPERAAWAGASSGNHLAMGRGGPLARRSRRSAKVATFLAERRGYWTSSALVLRMRRL